MVKNKIAGIEVPMVATSAKLREFVHNVFLGFDKNYPSTAAAIGVTPATIWKLEQGTQKDSQVIRDALGIRKTPIRPRVWMPTNNVQAAVEQLYKHYDRLEIIGAFMEHAISQDESGNLQELWHGNGREDGIEFPGLLSELPEEETDAYYEDGKQIFG